MQALLCAGARALCNDSTLQWYMCCSPVAKARGDDRAPDFWQPIVHVAGIFSLVTAI